MEERMDVAMMKGAAEDFMISPAVLRNAEFAPQQRFGPRSPSTTMTSGCKDRISVSSRAAGSDFSAVRLFVDAPLAARFPFECLYSIGDVGFFASDSGFLQGAVQ